MAEQIRRVDYFTITIANKVGEGAKLLTAIREAGFNLIGMWGYPAGRKAAVELVVEDAAAFGKALKKLGYDPGKKQTAFMVEGEDRIGAMADALSKLAAAEINVFSAKAICAGAGRFGGAIFVDPADVRKAAKALGV